MYHQLFPGYSNTKVSGVSFYGGGSGGGVKGEFS